MAFPLHHIWVAAQIFVSYDEFTLAGAILPDLEIFDPELRRDHKNFHESIGCALMNTETPISGIEKEHLLAGIMCHSIESHGLDWYSDTSDLKLERTQYDGYMYTKGHKLVPMLKELIDGSDDIIFSVAHNFIETAFSFNIARSNPNAIPLLEIAFETLAKSSVTESIAKASNVTALNIAAATSLYRELFEPSCQRSIDGYIQCWIKLANNQLTYKLSSKEIMNLITKSEECIEDSWHIFLDYTIGKLSIVNNKFLSTP